MSDTDPGGSRATIREVMALVDVVRKELEVEIDKLNAKLDARMETHGTRHDADWQTHQSDHRRENDRRSGYLRWAVTTILTGIGTLFAIIWAVTNG